MSNPLHEHIEAIEAGYEFLLAYAAQGRASDEGHGGADVRSTLTGMSAAANAIRTAMENDKTDFARIVIDDAWKTAAAIAVVLSQARISSELVDNLNASIHVRALLTDLFLLSETIQ